MKKALKKTLVAVAILISSCLSLTFSACESKYEKIYSDDSLIANYNSYGNSELTKTNGVDGLYVSSSSFSGVETLIYAFTVDSNVSANIKLLCNNAALGGKVKIVLSDSKNVYKIAECGQLSKNNFVNKVAQIIDFKDVPYGIYSLKIVGCNSYLEMFFSY